MPNSIDEHEYFCRYNLKQIYFIHNRIMGNVPPKVQRKLPYACNWVWPRITLMRFTILLLNNHIGEELKNSAFGSASIFSQGTTKIVVYKSLVLYVKHLQLYI